MIPNFVTDEYVEACRQARHVQGWWTATWEHKPGVLQFETTALYSPALGELHSMKTERLPDPPRWALPPVGTGLQTNVRLGDLFTGRDWTPESVAVVAGKAAHAQPGIFDV